jgi:hypothetical protein
MSGLHATVTMCPGGPLIGACMNGLEGDSNDGTVIDFDAHARVQWSRR